MCGTEGMVVVQEKEMLKLRGASSIQQTVIVRHVRHNSLDRTTNLAPHINYTPKVPRCCMVRCCNA